MALEVCAYRYGFIAEGSVGENECVIRVQRTHGEFEDETSPQFWIHTEAMDEISLETARVFGELLAEACQFVSVETKLYESLVRVWEERGEHERFKVGCRLYDQGYMIFHLMEGSTAVAVDSDQLVCDLLGLLSVRERDTDDEYFSDYSAEQLTWRDERAEELQLCMVALEDQLSGREG